MVDVQNLEKTLAEVAELAAQYSGKGLTEQDTKNALIEPILAALGWAKTNLDQVRAEYRHTTKDNPVDYALFSKSHPVLFVEAKALDHSIDEHKFVSQVISYANVAGVHWALLTNGRQWALYKVFAEVQGSQKRLFSVEIDEPAAADWLRWIIPSRLDGNDLDSVWRHCFAERRVRRVLRQMIADRDSDLVKFLSRRCGLSAQDVTAGLYHLRVAFDEPEPGPLSLGTPLPAAEPAVASSPSQTSTGATGRPPSPPPGTAPPASTVLPPPAAGSRPSRFWIGDSSWAVKYWRDLPVNTCAFLSEARPEQFQRAFSAEEFQGKKRRVLAPTSDGFRSAVAVPGGFVEVNLSASSCVGLVARLLKFCEVELINVGYELRDSTSGSSP